MAKKPTPHEEEAGQMVIVYQLLQQRLQELTQQASLIERTYFEIETSREGLNSMKDISKGELLVPMGNGLYIHGKGISGDRVLVNVGSNIVVEKTQKETEAILKQRSEELQQTLGKIAAEMKNVSGQMNQIASSIQKR